MQAAVTFKPLLTMGALKPFIASWVKEGIAALSTPLMVEAVGNAFTTNAFATEMRCPELYAAAKERARVLLPAAAAEEGEQEPGIDEDLDENSQLSLMNSNHRFKFMRFSNITHALFMRFSKNIHAFLIHF